MHTETRKNFEWKEGAWIGFESSASGAEQLILSAQSIMEKFIIRVESLIETDKFFTKSGESYQTNLFTSRYKSLVKELIDSSDELLGVRKPDNVTVILSDNFSLFYCTENKTITLTLPDKA